MNGDGSDTAALRMAEHALVLAELGVRVFPLFDMRDGACTCSEPECDRAGKHPRISKWQTEATCEPTMIRAWWARNPHSGIAIATGSGSGFVVLDVDGVEGATALAAIEQKQGSIGLTPTATTGHGRHVYFAHPGYPVRNSTGKQSGIAPGLDVRGDGGFVVAPPSPHRNGQRYTWITMLGTVDLQPMPAWLVPQPSEPAPRIALVTPNTRRGAYGRSALEKECDTVRGTRESGRNDQLNSSAFVLGQLVPRVLDENEVRAALLDAALATGLPKREALRAIHSGVSDGMNAPRDLPDPLPATGRGPQRQDAGVAAKPDTSTTDTQPRIQLVGPSVIFAPLPPMRWVSRELMIGAGRPTLLAAYGSSAKTLAMQSMLLSISAGRRIWNRFDVPTPLRVCHIDYEQGSRDTYHRYQRLALGHGIESAAIGDRLHVGAMPAVYLTSDTAYEDFCRVAQCHDLVLIDSLRAAVPGVDENESKVRAYIDILTRVSEFTGCAFILIHHAGKNGTGRDARQLARGSSAIFDACGCVLNLTIGKTGSDPRAVSMTKPPASSEGKAIEPFGLIVQDVAIDGCPLAGVSVTWQALPAVGSDDEASIAYEVDAARLLGAISERPGASQNTIALRAGMKKSRAVDVLRSLVADGRVSVTGGAHGAKTYWPSEGKS